MKKQQKLSPVKIVIFVVALGALVYGGSTLAQHLRGMNATDTRLGGLDKSLIGLYLDLVRNNDLGRPVSNDPTPQQFIVSAGESVTEIGRNLQQQGLVRDGDLFRLYVRYNNLDATINAGVFTLRPNMNIPEIAQSLQRARAAETQ